MHSEWDVESYKTDFESEEHWELKRNFMLAHKDRLPEDELVCLAQVFANIEFLGCRYPDETMRKVAELARGVVESYREKKKNSLKRTFVAASDAAAAKVKGLPEPPLKHQAIETGSKKKRKRGKGNKTISVNPRETYNPNGTMLFSSVSFNSTCISQNQAPKPMNEVNQDAHLLKTVSGLDVPVKSDAKQLNNSLKNFVLFICDNEHPVNLMDRNASVNKCKISWKHSQLEEAPWSCCVYLNDKFIARGTGEKNKASKESCARNAIEKLQSMCYTIKIKAHYVSENTVSPSALGGKFEEGKKVKCGIGEQIMKMMGWTGGGLGVQQQGRVEPVSLLSNTGRKGLGSGEVNSEGYFREKAKAYIKSWLRSDKDEDLVFSNEFSIEQRKILHQIATGLSLKSRSYGKNEQRQLVISKRPNPNQIVDELLKVGGKTSKYELFIPTHLRNNDNK